MQTIPETKSERSQSEYNQPQVKQIKQQKHSQSNISIFDGFKKTLKCPSNESKLVLHSKCLTFCTSLGKLIQEESQKDKKLIVLLVDLYDQEIQEIFNQLLCIRSKNLLKGDKFMPQFKMKKLNQVVKEKRKDLYTCSGVYALSSQVFLKDLLRFQEIIDLKNIKKIFIRISQKISNYYNSIGWISTLLKISKENLSIVYLCRQVQFYSQFQSLQRMYRTLFCNKMVIWPFGRSQIHNKLATIRKTSKQNQQCSSDRFQQFKHYLQMEQQSKKACKILQSLTQIVEKNYNKLHPQTKIKGMQLLYKQSIYRQLSALNAFQSEMNQFISLRYLFIALCNCDNLMVLTILSSLRHEQPNSMMTRASIWNSNNSAVTQLICQLQKTIKRSVVSLRKMNIDAPQFYPQKQIQMGQKNNSQQIKLKTVDLVQLIMNYHYDRSQNELAQVYDLYEASYELEYQLDLKLSSNQKLNQIIQIIQKLKKERQQKIINLKEELSQLKNNKNIQLIDKSIEEQIQLQLLAQLQPEKVLINCPNQLSKRYLYRELFSYVHNCQYLQYLRSLYKYLYADRFHRIAKLKIIYQRIKQKKKIAQQEGSRTQSNGIEKRKNSSQIQRVDMSSVINQQSNSSMPERQYILENKYEQKMQNVSQNQTQNAKPSQVKQTKQKKIGWIQKMTQNQVILQEYLYKQLSILMEIASHYQNEILTEQQTRFCLTQPISKASKKEASKGKKNKMSFGLQNKQTQKLQEQNNDNSLSFAASFSFKNKKNQTQNFQFLSQSNVYAFGSTEQTQKMFIQQVNRANLLFVQIDKLLIGPSYQSQTSYSIYSEKSKQQKLLIVSLFSPQKSSPNSDPATKFSQMTRLVNPSKCIFYSPHPSQIRSLYINYAQKKLTKLNQIRVLSFKQSFEAAAVQHQVKRQDQAFWNIAQNKSKLSQYKQDPSLRVKMLQMNDKFEKTIDFMNYVIKKDQSIPMSKQSIYRINSGQRRIIIDTRQFKSALPCYLFFYGFTIIPIQLQTADYILSDTIGVQKKSVQTKDLHLSLKSFRLDDQIKRMCQKFQRPYLLIECQQNQNFKKESFYQRNATGENNASKKYKEKDSYKYWIRYRLAQLIKKYPKLRILWSNSVMTTCQYFRQLKYDNAEPQIGKYLKNSKQDNLNSSLSQSSANQQQQQKQDQILQKMEIQ